MGILTRLAATVASVALEKSDKFGISFVFSFLENEDWNNSAFVKGISDTKLQKSLSYSHILDLKDIGGLEYTEANIFKPKNGSIFVDCNKLHTLGYKFEQTSLWATPCTPNYKDLLKLVSEGKAFCIDEKTSFVGIANGKFYPLTAKDVIACVSADVMKKNNKDAMRAIENILDGAEGGRFRPVQSDIVHRGTSCSVFGIDNARVMRETGTFTYDNISDIALDSDSAYHAKAGTTCNSNTTSEPNIVDFFKWLDCLQLPNCFTSELKKLQEVDGVVIKQAIVYHPTQGALFVNGNYLSKSRSQSDLWSCPSLYSYENFISTTEDETFYANISNFFVAIVDGKFYPLSASDLLACLVYFNGMKKEVAAKLINSYKKTGVDMGVSPISTSIVLIPTSAVVTEINNDNVIATTTPEAYVYV